MRRTTVLALVCLFACLQATLVLAENTDPQTFTAKLTAATDGPKPVVTTATGQFSMMVREDDASLEYELSLQGIEDVYMAHLHLSEGEGAYGPMVAWLYPAHHARKAQPMHGPINGVLCSCKINSSDLMGTLEGKTVQDLLDAIKAGKVYVNVHTERYPASELMGWLEIEK